MKPATPFSWTEQAVREALGVAPSGSEAPRDFEGISTDTRTLREGDLFVALRGPNHDAHAFLPDAAAKGAGAAVVSSLPAQAPARAPELPLYRVDDTLDALGRLARYRRDRLRARVVAVTGSSGKTTVKDLLAAALATEGRVHATRGNLNNRVGVPLTLLAAPDGAEFLVVELGTSEPGEIAALTRMSDPDLGLVITVGAAHLEGLGTLEGVLREKLALLAEMRAEGTAVVGDLPPELPTAARRLPRTVRVAGFSKRSDAELRGTPEAPGRDGRVPFRFAGRAVVPGIPGGHGAFDTHLALAVASLLGVPLEPAIDAVERVGPGAMRGERRELGALTLIVDCYNANPQSVKAALAHLASLPERGGRVAVLGSMLELGPDAEALHREALEYALDHPLALVVAVGEFAEAASSMAREAGGRLVAVPDAADAWPALRQRLRGREVVLLKASRGVRLERLLPELERAFGERRKAEPTDGTEVS